MTIKPNGSTSTKVFSFPITELVTGGLWQNQIKLSLQDYTPATVNVHLSYNEGDTGIAIPILQQQLNIIDSLSLQGPSLTAYSFNQRLRSLLLQKWSGNSTVTNSNTGISTFKFDCVATAETSLLLRTNWNTLFGFMPLEYGSQDQPTLDSIPLKLEATNTFRTHMNDTVMIKAKANENGTLISITMQSESLPALVFTREAFITRLEAWREQQKMVFVRNNNMEKLSQYALQHQDAIVTAYNQVNDLYAARRQLIDGQQVSSVQLLLQQIERTYQTLRDIYMDSRKFINSNVNL